MKSFFSKMIRKFYRPLFYTGVLFVAGFIFFANPQSAFALACTSQVGGSGNWNNTGSWDCARVPTTADTVVISTAQAITIDSAPNSVISVTINSGATLNGGSATLTIGNTAAAGTSFINNGGTFNAQTGKVVFSSNVSLTVLGGTGTFTGANKFNNVDFTPPANIVGGIAYTMGKAMDVGGAWVNWPTGTSNSRNLTVNLSGDITVTGAVTINGTTCNANTNGAISTVNVLTHTLTAGSIVLYTDKGTCVLTTSTGTVVLTGTSGTLMTNPAAANFAPGSGSTLSVTSVSGTPTLFSTAETVHHLTINCACTVTTGAATTVSGNLTITAGTLGLGTNNFTVTGTSGISGTLRDLSSTGTNLLTGLVTVSGVSGTFDNSGNSAWEFRGGLTNTSSNDLNMGTGATSFTTNSQVINGTRAITFGGNVSIASSVTVTNDNIATVAISGTLSGGNTTSTWTQGANSYLKANSGAVILPGNGNLNPSGSGNTVEFAGTNQDMTANGQLQGNYQNLLISGSNNTSPTFTVAVTLTISGSGEWTPSSGTITLSGAGTPFVKTGTFTPSGTQTMNFTGDGVTIICTPSYINLGLLPGGSTAQTICTTGGQTLTVAGSLTVGNGANAGATATANDPTINVTGSVTIANGAEFTSTSGNLSIGGNFTNSGTFTHANGTVIWTGAVSHTINGSSSTTFYSFSNTVAGSSLIFANNGGGGTPLYTFATGGTVTITGAEGNLITITSNNQPTNSWTVHFDEAQSGITYVDVYYSACDGTSATVTLGADSNDGAGGGTNGSCWSFGGGVTIPLVTTGSASGILSATLSGNVTDTNGEDVTPRGFAWGTDSTLATVFATTTETTGGPFGEGAFTQNVSGLISGTTYYFRAYATNSAGDGFGDIESFLAGSDTTPNRKLRLFEGFTIKLFGSSRIILHQQ